MESTVLKNEDLINIFYIPFDNFLDFYLHNDESLSSIALTYCLPLMDWLKAFLQSSPQGFGTIRVGKHDKS